MSHFNVPKQAKKSSIVVENFRGVDMTSGPAGVDVTRAAAAPNMIRDQVGTVRKRMGFTRILGPRQEGLIPDYTYGVHHLGSQTLLHQGAMLYLVATGSLEYGSEPAITLVEKGTVGIGRSRSFAMGGKLYLLTPLGYKVWDGTNLQNVSQSAYVPTVIISRRPGGGGTVLEGYNLIGSAWKESFLGTAEDTAYQLTRGGLDATAVQAKKMAADGTWTDLTEDTDFTVDRENGVVTFSTAPGVSPVSGQDNVVITASKANSENLGFINNCTVFALYGVGGAPDRVFLGGNAQKPGVDWYSGFNDPAYFPDVNYTQLSREGAQVAGYVTLSDTLVTFLTGGTDGRNVVVRRGSLRTDGEAVFAISNTLQGPELRSADSICSTEKEPLYVTENGVYTITAEELTGERISQERGYFVRNVLGRYDSAAYACMYQDFYVVAAQKGVFLLDTRQRSYEKNAPRSSWQYECYFWPIGVTNASGSFLHGPDIIWREGDALLFAMGSRGEVYRFRKNVSDPQSYNDDGEAIAAYWETTDWDGALFFHQKTFCGVAVRLASAIVTGVKISVQTRGIWKPVFDSKGRARYLDWSYIDFSKMTFSTDRTPRTLYGKIKVKKADKVRFRLLNDELNEPFGLYAFGVQYKEPGTNYKR